MQFVNRNPRDRARRPGCPDSARFRAILAVLLLLLVAHTVAAQPPPLNETRVRRFAREAQGESHGDPTALVLALDRRVRETWGDVETFPISIVRREDLLVTLSTPYLSYRRGVIDVLRTKRPIASVPWVDAVVISVTPLRLGAPDIDTIILARDGREVPSTSGTLRVMSFSNGAGDQGELHAGDVLFPPSALAPGAAVTLTIRPRLGDPFVYRFSDTELSTLR